MGWTAHTTYKCECHSGYENWRAHHGCQDINECCNKASPKCSHTCARTAPNVGVCYNRPGSYECRTCSLSGSQHFSDSGVIYSQASWSSGGYYSNYMRTHWHIKYTNFTFICMNIKRENSLFRLVFIALKKWHFSHKFIDFITNGFVQSD